MATPKSCLALGLILVVQSLDRISCQDNTAQNPAKLFQESRRSNSSRGQLLAISLKISYLMDIYNVTAEQLVNGELVEHRTTWKLDADDCLELVGLLEAAGKTEKAREWFNVAHKLFETGDRTVVESELKEFQEYYDDRDLEDHIYGTKYAELCRRKYTTSGGNYKCSEKFFPQEYRKIRLEQLNTEPLVQVYHDVLSSKEVEILLEHALTYKAENAIVQTVNGTLVERKSHRTATDHVLLKDNIVSSKLARKISLFKNQDTATKNSESGVVVQYGVGDEFKLHYDQQLANRLGGFILYINDILEGGNFVMPYLDLNVVPEKGNLLYWENADNNGNDDYRTLHAGCPILLGDKWIHLTWSTKVTQNLQCIAQQEEGRKKSLDKYKAMK